MVMSTQMDWVLRVITAKEEIDSFLKLKNKLQFYHNLFINSKKEG